MALHPVSLAALESEVGLSDMCLLEPLNEDNFIANLETRFNHEQIYTYIGNVVVSVNPYQNLPLYTPEVIFTYRSRNLYELRPHIYAIADDAYRSMRDRNLDQCVIISGESGAGKTEASKVIMQFVAAVSGKGKDIDRVKEQLLQSNPVLEAFGNAKTHKNDNSSRFVNSVFVARIFKMLLNKNGKYMDIEFDFKGDPIGGVITNYLLEKSRVAVQSQGERNFHIFYQLISGADTSFLKSLKLHRNPDHYNYLRTSGCTHMDNVDERQNFTTTRSAMEVIGFRKEEIVALFQLVACVLKLGNVQFRHQSNMDGTDGCKLVNDDEVYEVCEQLGCECSFLTAALTQRTVQTSYENVKTDLSSTEATYARDALCKAIYSRLFTWLVNKINDSIKVKTRVSRKSMGVLDIYGFEIFEHNSFEQFIINYCNEKLQQIFIELTLKEEQEEYIKEGIEWIHVEYFNNAIICELIENTNSGILALLDDECLLPGTVSDQTFLGKLNESCWQHAHFESRGCKKTRSDRSLPHDAFRLVHYAGTVTYDVRGFIDKNNDLLFRDLSQAMYACDHPLLKTLFPEGNPERTSLRRPATAGSQFKSSVNELMRNLQSKCPNYIRCIKPNEYKKPADFDDRIVRHQVRYLGLMENVRVRRAGYAFRQLYELFLYRFKMLSPATWPMWWGKPREGVHKIFDQLCIPQDDYAFGKTKVFISNPRTLFAMEERRRVRMHDLATLLQKVYRGWTQRQKYLRIRQAQITISSHYRGYKARTNYLQIRSATIIICAYVRGWKARKLLRQLKYLKKCQWAVAVIHKFYLGWQVRREYRNKFRATAGPKIVKFLRQVLCYMFLTDLQSRLPSVSPADRTWPPCSPLFRQASSELRRLHHRWRCDKYRAKCDQTKRNTLREKVAASDMFKDKKASYPRSVSHPFKGDYVKLRQNTKWKKSACETNDQHLVFADIVMKINRKNGKMVPQLLVLSNHAMLVMDQRTLAIKYRIPVTEVEAMSLSPYNDRLVVFHLKKYCDYGEPMKPCDEADEERASLHSENGDFLTKKGDFLLSSEHVIEIVAKMYLLVENSTGKKPPVLIATAMQSLMNGQQVEISFLTGIPNVLPDTVKISRKGNKLEILEA